MLYVSWQQMGTPHAPYVKASPNVRLIMNELLDRFGGANWGIYVYRAVRGGTQWSTHAWGGAGDWAYQADEAARVAAIDWLIVNHEALHVQMIVDENNDRTWKSSRPEYGGAPGWRAGKITTGGPWLHFETTPDHWANDTPIAARLTPPAPTPDPATEAPDMIALDYRRGFPDWTAFTYTGAHLAWIENGHTSAALSRAGITRIDVNRDELAGFIGSSAKTTDCPPTLPADLRDIWG